MLQALLSLTVYDLIHYAAMFEFAVLTFTFVVIVCILSVKTSLFMLKVTLDHAFSQWRRTIKKIRRVMARSKKSRIRGGVDPEALHVMRQSRHDFERDLRSACLPPGLRDPLEGWDSTPSLPGADHHRRRAE